MNSDHNDIIMCRKSAALLLISALKNDKKNSFSLWKEIHEHAFSSPGMCIKSLHDKSEISYKHSSDGIIKENSFHCEQSYNQYHSELDYETENLIWSMNQLTLVIEQSKDVANNNDIQYDSGYNSEELKCLSNDSVELEKTEDLIENIFNKIVQGLLEDSCSVDEIYVENCINLIRRAIGINDKISCKVMTLIFKAIEEITRSKELNKSSNTEKIFKIMQEICKDNGLITVAVIQYLLRNVASTIQENLACSFAYYEFNILFHCINTINVLLRDFEEYYKAKCLSDIQNIEHNENTNINDIWSKKKVYSVFRKMDKIFNRNIHYLERRCHLAQVLLLLRQCYNIVCNILKYCK